MRISVMQIPSIERSVRALQAADINHIIKKQKSYFQLIQMKRIKKKAFK